MNTNVLLRFDSNIPGNVVRLTIPRARMNLTAAEASDSMQGIIHGGIVRNSAGIPTGIKGAEIVVTERTQIEMA